MWQALLAADRAAGARLSALVVGSALEPLFVWASFIGRGSTIWLALGTIGWWLAPARRPAIWRLFLAVGLAALLVDGIGKPLIARARPFTNHTDAIVIGTRPTTNSFPSGHAAGAAAGATALARVWPAATLPFWALALTVAFSRIVVGVHFPSDVIGGLIVGYAVARFVCARPPREDAAQPLSGP